MFIRGHCIMKAIPFQGLFGLFSQIKPARRFYPEKRNILSKSIRFDNIFPTFVHEKSTARLRGAFAYGLCAMKNREILGGCAASRISWCGTRQSVKYLSQKVGYLAGVAFSCISRIAPVKPAACGRPRNFPPQITAFILCLL